MTTELAFDVNDPDFLCFLPPSFEGKVEFSWTDFNIHDTGVATLEAVNFALDNLAYSYSFPIQDLMQGREYNAFDGWSRQLLETPYAVTENDYRVVLAHVDGVINAALSPIKTPLNSDGGNTSDDNALDLLSVDVVYLSGEENEEACWQALLKERGIGDYFSPINVSRCQDLKAEVTVRFLHRQDTQKNRLALASTLQQALLPYAIPQYKIANSLSAEQILQPALNPSGFSKQIIVANLYAVLEDLSFVSSVQSIALKKAGDKEGFQYALIEYAEPMFSRLSALSINDDAVLISSWWENEQGLKADKRSELDKEQVRAGQYRELGKFNSLQLSYTDNYQIGNNLPADSQQSVPLRSFLYFMDQVRADRGAQMDNFSNLFAIPHVSNSREARRLADKSLYTHSLLNSKYYAGVLSNSDKWDTGNASSDQAYVSTMYDLEQADKRLNFLLALHGVSNLKPATKTQGELGAKTVDAHRAEQIRCFQQELQFKQAYLSLLQYGPNIDSCDDLPAIFRSTALQRAQQLIHLQLKDIGIENVFLLEHCFLAPVWQHSSDKAIRLNFGVSVFLFFDQGSSDRATELNEADKARVLDRVASILPVYMIPNIKYVINGGGSDVDSFKALLHDAFIPNINEQQQGLLAQYHPEKPLRDEQQRRSMEELYNDWVLPNRDWIDYRTETAQAQEIRQLEQKLSEERAKGLQEIEALKQQFAALINKEQGHD
ncbi:hypothetical protein PRUB_a0092 [Pseudoalteromonas rubra]|uniref:Uncharacterized protein n=1 Tax=Pseudoalteromonas rubra TaxID=43658 RepID=A0A8T0C6V0_9GAMM|nr:hypothetical protein [Pseudoalteromonas rubra]KAF7785725.1 hypothetical protein PRUB_a0092 [Pseudoalteromonas rubra]